MILRTYVYGCGKEYRFCAYSLLRGDRSRRGIESDEGRRSNNRIQYSFLSNDPFRWQKVKFACEDRTVSGSLTTQIYSHILSPSPSRSLTYSPYVGSVCCTCICKWMYNSLHISSISEARGTGVFYVRKIARIARSLIFLRRGFKRGLCTRNFIIPPQTNYARAVKSLLRKLFRFHSFFTCHIILLINC